jgi:hypothetical protein
VLVLRATLLSAAMFASAVDVPYRGVLKILGALTQEELASQQAELC